MGLTRRLIVLALAVATPILACGPFFPSSVLQGGDRALLQPHFIDFQTELERIPLPDAEFAVVLSTNSPAAQTFDAELAELREALAAIHPASADENRLCAEFETARRQLREYAEAVALWKERARFRGPGIPLNSGPRLSPLVEPAGLPIEFADYLAGSVAFHGADTNAAQEAWERLLKRPASQRQYRSVWAAFMLGKTWLQADPEEAAGYFQQTRALARAGFKDSLGLAAASYGWEAKAELSRGEYASAIRLYLNQHQAGDNTALVSLRLTMGQVLAPPQTGLLNLAADPVAQRVATGYLVSRRTFHDGDAEEMTSLMESWLSAVERAGAANVESADRLALAAYQRGLYELAERWLAHASANTAMAQWLRAKLLLRAGKVDEAGRILAQVVRLFPHEGDWTAPPIRSGEWDARSPLRQAMGELGVLRLARRQYFEALDVLLRSGYWTDAAYVAEYVLTPDELSAYVERQWPEPEPELAPEPERDAESEERGVWSFFDNQGDLRPEAVLPRIRWLTARRLARLQRWDEAIEFSAPPLKAQLEAFVRLLQSGRAPDAPVEERAQALWEAAQITRAQGMELFGTEVEPDWTLFDGQYDWAHLSETRQLSLNQGGSGILAGDLERSGSEQTLAATTPDEHRRIREHAPVPNRRFHYRYLAAEIGWEAAQLMPDNTDATARVLWLAGTWLKTRDPIAADRFYKALVRRCGQTALGQEAERLRWFPKADHATPPASDASSL